MKCARLRKKDINGSDKYPDSRTARRKFEPFYKNMEIKQGDTVRVSKDAPKMYLRGFDHIFTGVESVVSEVEDDNAVIIFNTGYINSQITIPTKYLVKVDAEAKEPRFKKGDKVRYIGDIQEHKGEMFVIDGDIFFNDYYKQWQASSIKTIPTEVCGICNVPLSDLEPDTKPTEQTEAEKKPDVGSIKIPVEVDLTDSYWDAYAANLAKDVALKVANKFNAPHEAAEYAVAVAKAVVERLKRK